MRYVELNSFCLSVCSSVTLSILFIAVTEYCDKKLKSNFIQKFSVKTVFDYTYLWNHYSDLGRVSLSLPLKSLGGPIG